jgi:hypothetical protein
VKRADESLADHGADHGVTGVEAGRRLGALLRYVDGDYRDPGTFQIDRPQPCMSAPRTRRLQ